MHKLNNRYAKAAIIGIIVFIITRIVIAVVNGYVEPDIPYPYVLSLISGGVAFYLTTKAVHY